MMPSMNRMWEFDPVKETRTKRNLIFFSFVTCAIAVTYLLTQHEGEVIRDYFGYGDALVNGILPFEPYNDLNWEYPPLAYLFLLIPRFFASDPTGYSIAYTVMITIFLLIGLWMIWSMAITYGKNAKILMSVYVLSMILLQQFFFDRFDAIVAVITLAALYLYLQKRYAFAFLMLAVGTAIKLYPGLLLLIFLMPLIASRDVKGSVKNIAVFAVSSVLLIIPFIIWSPENFLTFVSYHSDRGIQIESVASSVILFLEKLGLTSTQTYNDFGSANIEGGLADAIVPVMMPLMIVTVLLFYVIYYMHCRNEEDEYERHISITWASFLIVLLFVISNKVFSAQYLVWILMVMIPMLLFTKDDEWFNTSLLLFLAASLMTIYFVFMYDGLRYHDLIPVALLILRNIAMVLLLLGAFKYNMKIGDNWRRIRGMEGNAERIGQNDSDAD